MSHCQFYPLSSHVWSFDCLKHLSLLWVQDFDGAFQLLLSKCHNLEVLPIKLWPQSSESRKLSISLPRLQYLTIYYASRYSLIEIDAPNLTSLHVVDYSIFNLHIKNAPSLQKARLSFTNRFLYSYPNDHLQILRQHFYVWGATLQNISNLKILSLHNDVLKELLDQQWKFTLTNLKEFFVYGLRTTDSVYHLVEFFKNCHSLQEVIVSYRRKQEPPFLSTEQLEEHPVDNDGRLSSDFPDFIIHHLKRVTLVGFTGAAKQGLLLKFLLKRATALDTLMLEHYENGHRLELLHKCITLLPRISPNAKIGLSHRRCAREEAEAVAELYAIASWYIFF